MLAVTTPIADKAAAATKKAPAVILPTTPRSSVSTNIGTNNFKQQNISVKPGRSYIDNNALVEKRLEALLAKGNPLLKQAQLASNQTMNASGVANSGMATQLGTQAVLSKGLEIVQPDAALYGQAALQQQAAENTGAANTQNAAYDAATVQQQANNTAALQKQEAQINLDQAAFDAALAGASEQQKATISRQAQEFEARFNEALQRLNLNEEAKLQQAQTFSTASASLMTNISDIINNIDLNEAAKTAAIKKAQSDFYAFQTTAAAIAGIELEFV